MKSTTSFVISIVGFQIQNTAAFVSSLSPNSLWGAPPLKPGEENVARSASVPFLPKPALLDGTLPGDVGFDPFGFAGETKDSLISMREAELKHGRLAMLAVLGWPLAELFDKPIANSIGLPALLTKTGSSPSVLNGGLENVRPEYWIAIVMLAGFVESVNLNLINTRGKKHIPGDCNFDPLNLFPKKPEDQLIMQTKEINNGRLAMMAILGFVVQEALYNVPVISQTPVILNTIL